MATTPTVVLLPVWGVGHLMSMLEAGKRLLASSRALSLTVLVMQPPTEAHGLELAAHITREEASGLDVRFMHLPTVAPPTDSVGIEEFVSRFVQMHAPHVRTAVSALTDPVAALVLDFFCTTMLDVARELAVPTYVYFTSNAAMLALFLRLPALHEEVTVEFEEMEGDVDVPGLPPVPPSSLPTPVMDKTNPNYTWFVYHGVRFSEADGIVVNTAAELPDGFLDRTRGRGLVWPARAPQKEVLAHAAVGGFVTHCGWNSILESLWCGVPMAPWPLYAEQHLNAFLLVDYLGVAVAMRVDRKNKNFVAAAELERAVRALMGDGGEEGRKARKKALEMKAACRSAVEEGGSSHVALQHLSEQLHKGAGVVDVRARVRPIQA